MLDGVGRVTSTHPVRKKWKEVFVQHTMLQRQRRMQSELAKPAVLRGPKKSHVVILGLDRAGKSTFVYRLVLGRQIVSIPTVGANRETVTRGLRGSGGAQIERSFKFTDVGGITPMRALWCEYLKESSKIDVLAFMVDASDQDRIPMATAELARCVNLIGPNRPVIVLANKFDVHRALSAHQLSEKMRLRELFGGESSLTSSTSGANNSKKKSTNLWCCQSVSNVTGQGIAEALDWMVWSLAPTSDAECWFCRSQEVDVEELTVCSKCKHYHCSTCMQRGLGMCKYCHYCLRV